MLNRTSSGPIFRYLQSYDLSCAPAAAFPQIAALLLLLASAASSYGGLRGDPLLLLHPCLPRVLRHTGRVLEPAGAIPKVLSFSILPFFRSSLLPLLPSHALPHPQPLPRFASSLFPLGRGRGRRRDFRGATGCFGGGGGGQEREEEEEEEEQQSL